MRYTKILVPLDGSPLSESILPYALLFAEKLNAPIELLHVIDLDVLKNSFNTDKGRSIDEVQEALKSHAIDYLQRVALALPKALRVRQNVAIGPVPVTILAQAEKEAGTLLAMATRGHSGIKRWFLGSVADKVLHGARTPLLLFKGNPLRDLEQEPTVKRILVPLDGSGLAEQILSHVATLAKALQLEVEILRVYSLPVTVVAPASPAAYPLGAQMLAGDAFREEAVEYVQAKVQQLRDGAVAASFFYSHARGSGGSNHRDRASNPA